MTKPPQACLNPSIAPLADTQMNAMAPRRYMEGMEVGPNVLAACHCASSYSMPRGESRRLSFILVQRGRTPVKQDFSL